MNAAFDSTMSNVTSIFSLAVLIPAFVNGVAVVAVSNGWDLLESAVIALTVDRTTA